MGGWGALLGRAEDHRTRQVHWSQRLVSSFGSKLRKTKNLYEGAPPPCTPPPDWRACVGFLCAPASCRDRH